MKEFMSFSLVVSLYKMLANVLDIILGSVMDKLIFHSQSSFLKGRMMSNGMLVVDEAINLAEISK